MWGWFKQRNTEPQDEYTALITAGNHMPPYCGMAARHSFRTRVVRGRRNNECAYVVYTPPMYNPARVEPYPLLVLLHGWTDTEMSWCERGNLNGEMDHGTLGGTMEQAVVLMPSGYGDMAFAKAKFSVWKDLDRVRANTDGFCESLRTEVLPAVEARYNVTRDRTKRVIGGLSMGGLQALVYGLRAPEQFSRILTMSTALDGENLEALLGSSPALTAEAQRDLPMTLDITCGVNDPLLPVNRALAAWATEKNLPVRLRLTTGAHNWLTWRADLSSYLPKMFSAPPAVAARPLV